MGSALEALEGTRGQRPLGGPGVSRIWCVTVLAALVVERLPSGVGCGWKLPSAGAESVGLWDLAKAHLDMDSNLGPMI